MVVVQKMNNMKKAPFKLKSPMKQKGRFGIAGLSSSEKSKFFKESKARAKEAFKRDAAKTGHGTIEDLKAKSLKRKAATSGKVKKIVTKVAKKGAGRLAGGPIGVLAGMAYGAYKSGKAISGGKAVKGQKSFMAEAKKKTKSMFKK